MAPKIDGVTPAPSATDFGGSSRERVTALPQRTPGVLPDRSAAPDRPPAAPSAHPLPGGPGTIRPEPAA